jgi:murein DD-endopeptidase MepM/ murein hydrolase activator NlpD
VVTAEFSESYGNYIVLRHDENYSTVYAHCSKLLCKTGEKGKHRTGDRKDRADGNATGPHLHFELRKTANA